MLQFHFPSLYFSHEAGDDRPHHFFASALPLKDWHNLLLFFFPSTTRNKQSHPPPSSSTYQIFTFPSSTTSNPIYFLLFPRPLMPLTHFLPSYLCPISSKTRPDSDRSQTKAHLTVTLLEIAHLTRGGRAFSLSPTFPSPLGFLSFSLPFVTLITLDAVADFPDCSADNNFLNCLETNPCNLFPPTPFFFFFHFSTWP